MARMLQVQLVFLVPRLLSRTALYLCWPGPYEKNTVLLVLHKTVELQCLGVLYTRNSSTSNSSDLASSNNLLWNSRVAAVRHQSLLQRGVLLCSYFVHSGQQLAILHPPLHDWTLRYTFSVLLALGDLASQWLFSWFDDRGRRSLGLWPYLVSQRRAKHKSEHLKSLNRSARLRTLGICESANNNANINSKNLRHSQ